MKKILIILLVVCLLLQGTIALGETIVTSFYPVWLMALNLTDGIPELNVRNLAAPDTGCLHDYQLQTGDMKVLAEADVFLVNGGGMESYLDHVFGAFPELTVVVASEGISYLSDVNGIEIGDAEEDDLVNAHVWLDASNMAIMTEITGRKLAELFPQHAEKILENTTGYVARLNELDGKLKEMLATAERRDIVTFHEAFPYFAQAYGLNIVAVVNKEPGETLSPAQMGKLIDTVRKLGNPPLFTEPQYEELSARILAAETGSEVYSLDPVVTGPEENVPLTYYEDRMTENARVLTEALSGK